MKSIEMTADALSIRSGGVVNIAPDIDEHTIPIRIGGVTEEFSITADADVQTIPPHPLGIKPSGNLYTATDNARLASGNFQQLPDEILMTVLESFDADILCCLSSTCKALYAFCHSEELWKALFIEYVYISVVDLNLCTPWNTCIAVLLLKCKCYYIEVQKLAPFIDSA